MAESFACKSGWIHFSNSSIESLFAHWIRIATVLSDMPGMTTVNAFLQSQLDKEGPGCRGFGLYGEYLPDELADSDAQAALGRLIDDVIRKPQRIDGSIDLDETWKSRLKAMKDSLDNPEG